MILTTGDFVTEPSRRRHAVPPLIARWAPALCLIFAAACQRAPAPRPALSQQDIASVVDAYTALLEKKSADTLETIETQRSLGTDVNADGVPEIVWLYLLKGPTYWSLHLALFARAGDSYALTDNVKLDGSMTLDSVRGGTAYLHGKTYAENDPVCCPSQPVSRVFVVKGKKFSSP